MPPAFLRQMFQRSKGAEFPFPISTTLCSMGKVPTPPLSSRYGVTISVDKEELRVSYIWTSIRPLTQSHTTSFFLNWREGLDGWTVQWVRNWLDGCIQRVAISGPMPEWRPVISCVTQGSIFGPVQFDIYINDKVGLSVSLASLPMTPSCAVWLTHLRSGTPFRGTWTSLRSGLV